MKLLIAGAGGHGRVVADAAVTAGCWSEIAFVDDRYPELQMTVSWPIVGRLADLPQLFGRYDACLAAFGDARLRLKILDRAAIAGFDRPTVIHSKAAVSRNVQLGAGTVVLAVAAVNIGAKLGVGCIVNTGATVDHDCQLDEGVHICPGAHLGGDVTVGARTWVGIGAVVKHGIRIGTDVLIGAGAVCVKDIPDSVKVMGLPAREKQA